MIDLVINFRFLIIKLKTLLIFDHKNLKIFKVKKMLYLVQNRSDDLKKFSLMFIIKINNY